MLKFFRKIRQNLVAKGKSIKYLKYALGEILLVVIGILIALEVNNWNNELKDLKKENYYLNSIKTSIQSSQDELNRVIYDAEQISSCADTLFILLGLERYDQLKSPFLDSLLFNASDYSKISLNDGGIQEILNTGALDIIQDERIRVILASWNERIHKIRKFEDESEYLSRNYDKQLLNYVDYSKFISDPMNGVIIAGKRQELLKDPMIRNYLGRIVGTHGSMEERYRNERKLLDSLVALIDDYLTE